jgi:hypothetical protein
MAGADRPLDAFILERAARALHALTEGSAHRSTSGLVRIVCVPDASTEDRRNAVAQLGLTGPVTVVLSTSPDLRAPVCTAIGTYVVAPWYAHHPQGISAGAHSRGQPR